VSCEHSARSARCFRWFARLPRGAGSGSQGRPVRPRDQLRSSLSIRGASFVPPSESSIGWALDLGADATKAPADPWSGIDNLGSPPHAPHHPNRKRGVYRMCSRRRRGSPLSYRREERLFAVAAACRHRSPDRVVRRFERGRWRDRARSAVVTQRRIGHGSRPSGSCCRPAHEGDADHEKRAEYAARADHSRASVAARVWDCQGNP